MLQLKLHELITDILQTADRPMSCKEIADIISFDSSYHLDDGRTPNTNHVMAQVNQYPNLFRKLTNRQIVLKRPGNNADRMFRLTWNTTGWQYPVPHKWKIANQGKKNIAFENQYGFGGEEWLFNPRYMKDGYQYGFIRGVSDLADDVTLVSKAWLFSLDQDSRERFIVGQINELEVIKADPLLSRIAQKLYNRYLNDVKAELRDIAAAENGLQYGLVPNVRFRITGDELFDVIRLAPGLGGHQYNRFIPYLVDTDLQALIDGALPKDDFIFGSGVARTSLQYERITTPSNRTIRRDHGEISKKLEEFFKPDYTRGRKNLSIEKTRFGENIADVVLRHGAEEITILEIKTSGIARKNIREALGQLLDYGCWYSSTQIRELIIVAPSVLSTRELAYLHRLRDKIGMPLSYWQFLANPAKGERAFKKIL